MVTEDESKINAIITALCTESYTKASYPVRKWSVDELLETLRVFKITKCMSDTQPSMPCITLFTDKREGIIQRFLALQAQEVVCLERKSRYEVKEFYWNSGPSFLTR